ncbi:MAG TPA: 50S ribosomal protein L18, partial [Candidatus Paceibacterota bacterium]
MNSSKKLNQIRARRTGRTRARISGTAERPRLTVFRSNRGM